MVDFLNKNPASCFIELEPELYDDGSWTGALRILMGDEEGGEEVPIAEPEENSLEVVSKDGNIINLDFKTKTRGEA